MFVRLHCVAGAQCQTRPFLSRAGGSHCVFVVCPAGSVPKTRNHLLCVADSLSRERMCGVRASGPLQTLSPLWLLTFRACVCVCMAPLFRLPLHPSFCPLPAGDNQISDTGASALAAALNGSQLTRMNLGEYFEPFGD